MSGSKASIRTMVRQRLNALSPEALVAASMAIIDRLLTLPELMNATVVALFRHTPGEPTLLELAHRLPSPILTFPRWNQAETAYEMAVVETVDNDFVPGKFGIMEPSSRCRVPTDSEREGTVWLVPGLAFDASGGRLGRGGGFYDRLLRYGKTKIGVAFSCQLVERVPTEVHDVTMDMVVTDSATLTCRPTMDNRKYAL